MASEQKPAPPGIPPLDAAIARRMAADVRLAPFAESMRRRHERARALRAKLLAGRRSLTAFADGHERFGLFRSKRGWVLREWAQNATSVHVAGPFSQWKVQSQFELRRADDGVFELEFDRNTLRHGMPFRYVVRWPGGQGERLPAYAQRVVQNEHGSWDAEVWSPTRRHRFRHPSPVRSGPLRIYETHIGMAQQEAKVGSFDEFRLEVLPRIERAGYDALQIMALAEHPYYASFGYQVSSFFAASSRFGTPTQLMELIDAAHERGLLVLMDLVHSHCARNEVEGISRQDGSAGYCRAGSAGEHPRWGSRLFDYTRPETLRFLLSNCRFWLERFHVDGFRFDGVTSMLYRHHGLDHVFTSHAEYFADTVDEDALAYLTLANELIHEVAPHAITIAEDVSGMPGLALPIDQGGAGFDYRFAMGVADHWIKLVKDTTDEKWPLQRLWYELTNRRRDEKSISYAESHDQALVGDQTLIFRLIGARMYDRMSVLTQDVTVDRGIALHKLIRLTTLATAGHGYLNFMGNEFGHPEWIDFPREGNGFSHAHARRQWRLADDPLLRYQHLGNFDRALLALARQYGLPDGEDEFLLQNDDEHKVLSWLRAGLVFVVNFHPTASYSSAPVPAAPGEYELVLDSDRTEFGGHGRQDASVRHHTITDRIHRHFLYLYLPARTALVLRQVPTPATAAPA